MNKSTLSIRLPNSSILHLELLLFFSLSLSLSRPHCCVFSLLLPPPIFLRFFSDRLYVVRFGPWSKVRVILIREQFAGNVFSRATVPVTILNATMAEGNASSVVSSSRNISRFRRADVLRMLRETGEIVRMCGQSFDFCFVSK